MALLEDRGLFWVRSRLMQADLRDFLRLFLGFGLFMILCSASLLVTSPADSPEYVLSFCNILIGAVMVLSVVIFLRVLGGYGQN